MAGNSNYLGLINRSITNFNDIYTALCAKKDEATNVKLVDMTQTHAVESYDDFINSLRYIVEYDRETENATVPTDLAQVIYYHSDLGNNKTYSLTNISNGYGFTNMGTVEDPSYIFRAAGTLTEAGYYTTDSKLSVDLAVTNISLNTARTSNKFVLGTDNIYRYTASGSEVIQTISANRATITNTSDMFQGTYTAGTQSAPGTKTATDVGVTATATLDTTATKTTVTTADSGKFKVTVNANATASGTVTAVLNSSVTEGYTEAITNETVKTVEINKDAAQNSATVYLQEGAITVKSKTGTSATATVSDNNAGIIQTEQETGVDYYTVTAGVTGIEFQADLTEGYIDSDTTVTTETPSVTAGTRYIKHAVSTAVTKDLSNNLTLTDAGSITTTGDSGKSITITVSEPAFKPTISEGYIKTSELQNITLSGSKTVKIKESSAVAKYNISNYTPTSDTTNLISSSETKYAITVTPTVTVDTSATTEGWIDGASDITTGAATGSKASGTVYVKAGSVEVPNNIDFSATFIGPETNEDGDRDGTLTDIGNIFLTPSEIGITDVKNEEDAIKDYGGDIFKVNANLNYTVNTGFVEGSTGSSSVTRYMPKAVIENVTSTDGKSTYYQVKTAGYLPTGVLSDISTVRPSYAAVNLKIDTATGTGIVLASMATGSTEDDYYQITLSKNSVTPGYISAAQGTISGTAYIAKGSASAAPSVTHTDISVAASKTTDNKYAATVSYTANSNLNVEPGYITANEVSTDTSITSSATLYLNRATFGSTTHTTNASINYGDAVILETDSTKIEASSYKFTPKIDSCSTAFTVASAGWISNNDSDILKFESENVSHSGTMTSIALHAGEGITSQTAPGNNDISVTDDFSTTATTGDYTITVGGSVSSTITLDQGYYGAAEASDNITLAVSKTYSVARGAIEVTPTGTNEITSTDLTLYSDSTKGSKTVYAINALVDEASVTRNIKTAGYVKDASDITIVPADFTAGTKYVEAYLGGTVASSNDTFTAIQVGQSSDLLIPVNKPETEASVILSTANKYALKDAKVELTAHAMGSNVIAALAALEARMDGDTDIVSVS